MGNIGISDIEYIRFKITSGEVFYRGIRAGSVIELPDGRGLFKSELWNGLDVIAVSWPRVWLGDGRYSQKISLFDKQFDLEYKGELAIRFKIRNSSANHYDCVVKVVSDDEETSLGVLRMFDCGGKTITLDDEPVSDAAVRRLCVKAVLYSGKPGGCRTSNWVR